MRLRTLAIAGLAGLAAAAPAAHSGSVPQPPQALPFPELGTYEGGLFPADLLLGLGLSCNLASGALECFDTPAQALAAGPVQPRPGARCHPALRIWQDAGRPSGGRLAYYDTGRWQTLPPGWANQVSSFATGCDWTARFSDLPEGGGAQLLRPARTAGDMPPGWDDRVDAIYRG